MHIYDAQAMESEQLRRTSDPNESLRVMRLGGQMRQLGLDCASKATLKCVSGWEPVEGEEENRIPDIGTTPHHPAGRHRRNSSGNVDWVMLA
jgi:hypothetical protein